MDEAPPDSGPPMILDGEVPRFAANGVALAGGRWVMHLLVNGSVIRRRVGGGEVAEIPIAQIDISWTLAKALRDLLTGVIDEYERENGPIALPKSFQPKKPLP